MKDAAPRHDLAEAMRRAFDRSFAEPPRVDTEERENLLAVRVAGAPYAMRLSEVGGLFADRTVVRVPTGVPEFLGVAGVRGAIIPVFDLAALIGQAGRDGAPAGGALRWIVVARARRAVGFAFAAFETYVRVPAASVKDAVDAAGAVRPVIQLASVVEAIEQRVGANDPRKER